MKDSFCCCLVAKSCLTLFDPIDCNPPDSSVHGISQARILEWVAISYSRALPDPGIEPTSPAWQVEFCHWATWEAQKTHSVQFNCSVMSDPLKPHGLQHARLPCPSPTPRACLNSYPSSQWCHQTISSSVVPFSSHLNSFTASGYFPMSQFFASVAKVLKFQLQHQFFQWIFRTDFL